MKYFNIKDLTAKSTAGMVVEIIMMYVIIDCINLIFFYNDLGFLRFYFSPYWIPVLAASCRYGFWPGLVAGIIGALHVVGFKIPEWWDKESIEMFAETYGLDLSIALPVVGAILGALRERYKSVEGKLREEAAHERDRLDALELRFRAAEKTRRAIEEKVTGRATTIKTLYKTATKLQLLEGASPFETTLKVLAERFGIKQSSAYLVKEDKLVLQAAYGWEPDSNRIAEGEPLERALHENRMITVKELDQRRYRRPDGEERVALALLPIRDSEYQAVGVIVIEEMEFLSLSYGNLELIELIVDWASRSLANQKRYSMARGAAIWDESSGIFTATLFHLALKHEFAMASRLQTPLSLALIEISDFAEYNRQIQMMEMQTLVRVLRKKMLPFCHLCHFNRDGIVAVIAPLHTMEEIERWVQERQLHLAELKSGAAEAPMVAVRAGFAELSKETPNPESLIAKAALSTSVAGKTA